METQPDAIKEVLSELFALLETQETNSTAVLHLLKDQGIASDEKLSTYLDQAGRASNVRWRAARMRMEYLLTPTQKQTSENNKSKEAQPKEAQPKEAQPKEAQPKEMSSSAEEDKGKNQRQEDGNEKKEAQAEAKSAGNTNAQESPDQKSDAGNATPKNDQNATIKQTA
jgi:outer membrane biosynthesis protein TonB